MPDKHTSKIAIIGAGSVGATIAYACLIRGIGKQLALFDIDRKRLTRGARSESRPAIRADGDA